MKPLISEFSYGYALTVEMADGRVGSLIGAPLFPSLLQEGRTGGGYDVQLPRVGIPLFLQFKLGYYMKTAKASERNFFSRPYYRMYLRPPSRSRQHELLQALEAQGNEVYYVAPEFHTIEELNTAYRNNEVCERSAFFRPSEIRLPDDKEHYVAFSVDSSTAWCCSPSPPAEVSKVSARQLMHSLSVMARKGTEVNDQFFESLGERLIRLLQHRHMNVDRIMSGVVKDELTERKLSGKTLVNYLARSYFETEIFIVGPGTDMQGVTETE